MPREAIPPGARPGAPPAILRDPRVRSVRSRGLGAAPELSGARVS